MEAQFEQVFIVSSRDHHFDLFRRLWLGGAKPASNDNSVANPTKSEIISKLQGEWRVEKLWVSLGDEPVLVDDLDGEIAFKFRKDAIMTLQDGEETDNWLEYSIDCSQSPVWISTSRWKGLVKIEEDVLTISLGIFSRPSGFDFSDHAMVEQYTLSRVVGRRPED